MSTDPNQPSVAILGLHKNSDAANRWPGSLQELIYSSASGALREAGLDRSEIDGVVISSSDLADGRGISSMTSAPSAGAYLKHETRTTNDGLYALILGCLEIMSGAKETVLVSSWFKASEVNWAQASRTTLDPFYIGPICGDELTVRGLQATATILSEGAPGPSSHQPPNGAETLAWPVTSVDIPPMSDGSYSLVLADARIGQRIGQPLAYVQGFGWNSDTNDPGSRDLGRSRSLDRATSAAYRMAGITSSAELDVIEYVARATHEHKLVRRGLLSPLTAADPTIVQEDPDSALAQRQPALNPSGPWGPAHAVQAAGLLAAMNVTLQLAHRATDAQVPGATTGVAHGQSGLALQSNAVVVLSTGGGEGLR